MTVVALFAGYHDVGDGFFLQVINMLVTVVVLFAGYQDVGDSRRVVCPVLAPTTDVQSTLGDRATHQLVGIRFVDECRKHLLHVVIIIDGCHK